MAATFKAEFRCDAPNCQSTRLIEDAPSLQALLQDLIAHGWYKLSGGVENVLCPSCLEKLVQS